MEPTILKDSRVSLSVCLESSETKAIPCYCEKLFSDKYKGIVFNKEHTYKNLINREKAVFNGYANLCYQFGKVIKLIADFGRPIEKGLILAYSEDGESYHAEIVKYRYWHHPQSNILVMYVMIRFVESV